MRKNFFTGLAILLPMAITFGIVFFLFHLLTNPFIGFMEGVFSAPPQIATFVSRLLILALLCGAVLLVGFLTRVFFINYFFRLGDYLIHRIPFVNKIYKATQDVTKTLFEMDTASFSHPVFVRYPHSNCYSLGFAMGDKNNQISNNVDYAEEVSVLLPGTPNPTLGFILVFRKEDVIYMDIKPEEAIKYVISCGVIMPDLKPIEPPQ